mgnify:CR=1 FL=1
MIIAYFKDGTDTVQIKQILLKKKIEGGLYDYAQEWFKRDGENEANELIGGGLDTSFVYDTFNKVFVTEYREDIIYPAVRAIQVLSDKGIAKEEIINLLINEPLSKWSKVIKRMEEIESK